MEGTVFLTVSKREERIYMTLCSPAEVPRRFGGMFFRRVSQGNQQLVINNLSLLAFGLLFDPEDGNSIYF
jgi:hypothetical protein